MRNIYVVVVAFAGVFALIGTLIWTVADGTAARIERDAAIDTITRTGEGRDAAIQEDQDTRDLDDDDIRERLLRREW